jgi:hypothetical protein
MFDKRLLTASETSLKKEELIEKLISRMNWINNFSNDAEIPEN